MPPLLMHSFLCSQVNRKGKKHIVQGDGGWGGGGRGRVWELPPMNSTPSRVRRNTPDQSLHTELNAGTDEPLLRRLVSIGADFT